VEFAAFRVGFSKLCGILGGAALQRCDKDAENIAASAAEVTKASTTTTAKLLQLLLRLTTWWLPCGKILQTFRDRIQIWSNRV